MLLSITLLTTQKPKKKRNRHDKYVLKKLKTTKTIIKICVYKSNHAKEFIFTIRLL